MSIAFNLATTEDWGLVQFYEDELEMEPGEISGDTSKLKRFTAECNQSFDSFMRIALPASGKWRIDDSNHTKYPIITRDIVSGQRDYKFTVDEQDNLILDFDKVMVADASGVYNPVTPVDQQSDLDVSSFFNGQNVGGVPTRYDKTANGLFFDVVPNYNYTNGIKCFINREASYFSYDDDTEKPGVPGIFHDYFYKRPAREYARRKSLDSFNRLNDEVMKIERQIAEYFAGRDRNTINLMTPSVESTK